VGEATTRTLMLIGYLNINLQFPQLKIDEEIANNMNSLIHPAMPCQNIVRLAITWQLMSEG